MPSFMSGIKNIDDFDNQSYCYICLTTIWKFIKTSNYFNRSNSFLSYTIHVTVSVTYNPIWAIWPRSCRLCPGVRMWMTLIIKRIVKHAWPQFGISLTHLICLIVLIVFYPIHGNVTVSVTYNLILASWPRRRRKCPGVRLRTTSIIRHIVSYIWTEVFLKFH